MGSKVKPIGSKVEPIGSKVEPIGSKVERIGSKVERIGSKVERIRSPDAPIAKLGTGEDGAFSKRLAFDLLRFSVAHALVDETAPLVA